MDVEKLILSWKRLLLPQDGHRATIDEVMVPIPQSVLERVLGEMEAFAAGFKAAQTKSQS